MESTQKQARRLRQDERATIERAFEYLDTDRDGFLDYYETKAATRALGLDAKKAQLTAIMRANDKRDDDKINFQDFCYVMADKIAKRDPLDELKYAYKLFSGESPSGKITIVDLRRINDKLNCRLSDEEMEAMIEEFDVDQDGCIDEAEFIRIMKDSTL